MHYCSRIPSTLLPRSVTSRFMRRASMRSESHWTKIYAKTLNPIPATVRRELYLQVIKRSQCGVMQGQDTFG